MISPPYKVFLSAPADFWLTPDQIALKQKIIEMLQTDGFEVELMGVMGMPFTRERTWTHRRAEQIIQCCQGFIVLGLPRWYDAHVLRHGERDQPGDPFNLITEYSHSEGALAFAHRLPALFIIEDGVPARGILEDNNTLVGVPQRGAAAYIAADSLFQEAYAQWRMDVQERHHVFFGYSSGASPTANLITTFLRSQHVQVRDWQDFASTGTILEQIQEADRSCLGGIFLFTGEDTMTSDSGTLQAPRDNVIFEAGYFVNSKSEKRVQIILEKGTELLTDLLGQIYLPLEKRDDISSIETKLLAFVRNLSYVKKD